MLEIRIGTGNFTDFVAAGGSFTVGAYNGTITTSSGNPLAGRQAWCGSSGGWITTTVNLPPAAAGQNVQLRWICATDTSNAYGGVGWYVDSITVTDSSYACCSMGVPPTAAGLTNQMVWAGTTVNFIPTLGGTGPLGCLWRYNTTNLVAGATNPTLSLSNVQSANAGLYSIVVTNLYGAATNSAMLTVNPPPAITTQPASQIVPVGSNALFRVAANGLGPSGS
ncbi:MAG: hypothetical protein NTW03_05495 [Verrucomicrobia bacterium]|nr:hypothetical protein [Verrucomicrobiota bacterium]